MYILIVLFCFFICVCVCVLLSDICVFYGNASICRVHT